MPDSTMLQSGYAYSRRAATAATCPASEVTNVLRLVIDDNSENSPVFEAHLGEVMTVAVVYSCS